MGGAPLPPGYESWQSDGRRVVARGDVAATLRDILAAHPTLYAWAGAQAAREVFTGRGETYGVSLGPVRAVVRHARRGGLARHLSHDRFAGRTPRFRRELALSVRLQAHGIPTPAFLAGVSYPSGLGHTADVATERVDGRDLAAVFFGDAPPQGADRTAALTDVAHLVRHLHDAGFVHPDLQLRNVLLCVGASVRPCAFLLDVDTVRTTRSTAAKQSNLARFFRSWDKLNTTHGPRSTVHGPRLSPEDRATFMAAYAGTQ